MSIVMHGKGSFIRLLGLGALVAVASCAPGEEKNGGVGPENPLAELQLSPATVSLDSGAVQHFTVTGRLADGAAVTPGVTWTVSGGALSTGGDYTAGTIAGTFRVIARSTEVDLADTSLVTITVPPPPPPTLTGITMTPGSATLPIGGTQQFLVSGHYSDGSNGAVSATYTATGGTVTPGGLYSAGGTAGSFRIIATASGGFADTSSITIAPAAPTLQAIVLTPPAVTLQTGTTQQFAVRGVLSNGDSTTVSVTYSMTGGTITGGGLYTAGSTAGTYRVIATQQGGTLADTSSVTITAAPPTLTSVVLTPPTASLQPGGTQQFTASGRMSDGSSTPVTVTYTATGGTITTGGLYTAGSLAGSFRVIATQQQPGTLADTSAITITVPPPTLTSLTLAPPSANLQAGATQQFTVSGTWSDGQSRAVAVNYSMTGGTITSGGLYTAGATAGTFRVIATHQGGTLADTSAVTITVPPPVLTGLSLTPSTATIPAGSTQQFTVTGAWSDGQNRAVTVTYSVSGGTITGGGLYTAGSTAGNFRVIATQQGGTLADTSAVTITVTAGTAECGSGQPAAWIWCDDFEANRLASYFEYDNAGGRFTRVAGIGKDNSTGMKAVYTTAANTSSGALHLAFGKLPSASFHPVDAGTAIYRDIYWRVYVRNAPNWIGGAGDKLSRATSFVDGSTWAQAMIAHVWGTLNSTDLVVDPASGTNEAGQIITTEYNDFAHLRWLGLQRGTTPLFDANHVGQWYCVEARARLNDAGQANGLMQLWVNGTLETQASALNFVGAYSTYGINAVFLENFWNDGAPQQQERYLDNFVVSTARIGC